LKFSLPKLAVSPKGASGVMGFGSYGPVGENA